jgi:daunorubicin resistance ABC transporter membrane protein
MSRYDRAVVDVLWRRDMKRFVRQPSRLLGALGQPVIFWLILGLGLTATFQMPGLDIDYLEFFFPGVTVMVVVFASIFAAVSVIEDRHQGFLQAIVAGPASRAGLVVGKCLGSATVAGVQAALFLALAPLAGYSLGRVDWLLLVATLVATSLALTAVGFALAWAIDSIQGYHALGMTAVLPLWVLSGAVFPPHLGHAAFTWVMVFNPLAYAVSATRHALYGGQAPAALTLSAQPWWDVAVVAVFALVALLVAVVVSERRR